MIFHGTYIVLHCMVRKNLISHECETQGNISVTVRELPKLCQCLYLFQEAIWRAAKRFQSFISRHKICYKKDVNTVGVSNITPIALRLHYIIQNRLVYGKVTTLTDF